MALATLSIDLVAKLAQLEQDLGKAVRISERNAESMERAFLRAEGGVQRLQGSLEGLGKVGLGALIGAGWIKAIQEGAEAIYEASVRAERLRTVLDFSSGGRGASELDFVRKVAGDLGLELNATAKAYGGLAAAARGTSLEGDRAKDVFSAVAKAASVMGLSADDTSGVLLALQQMISKGKVSAEELNGQLGERLPGAAQIAARAMGVTTAELGKMMEDGELLATDFLPKFARQLNEELGGAAEAAANRLEAGTNRMGNAWERLKTTVGDTGLARAMSTAAGGLGNDMTAISEAMERARVSGKGFFGQMNDGLGMLIGRSLGLSFLSEQFRTLDQRIAAAGTHLQDLQTRSERGLGIGLYEGGSGAIPAAQDKLDALTRSRQALTGDDGSTGSDHRFTRIREAAVAQEEAAKARRTALAEVTGKLTNVNKDYEKSLKAIQESANAGDISEQRRVELLTDLARQYGKNQEAAAASAAKSALDDAMADIKRREAAVSAGVARSAEMLEAMRGAQLITEEDYYAARRRLVEQDAQNQSAALEAEARRLQQQSIFGKDADDIAKQRADRDRQVADLASRAVIVRAAASGKLAVLDTQEAGALKARAAALNSARIAQEQYLYGLQEAQRIELAGAGVGDAERQRLQGRQQISERYQQQLQQLESDKRKAQFAGTFDSRAEDQYKKELELIGEFRVKALDSFDEYYKARREQEKDAGLGMAEAFNNYLATAGDTFSQARDASANAFRGMEQSLASFVRTGRFNFASLRDSVLSDLALMESRALLSGIGRSLMSGSLLASVFGTSGTAAVASAMGGDSLDNFLALNGNFAANALGAAYDRGGRIRQFAMGDVFNEATRFRYADGLGELGEAGPEAVMPLKRGKGGRLGVVAQGGGGVVIQATYNIGQGVSRAEVTAAITAGNAKLKTDILRSQRRQGAFSS